MMGAEGAVKVPVHFEVYVKPTSHCDENLSAIEGAVLDYISTCKFYTEGLLLSQDAMTDDETSALRQHVDELIVTDIGCGATVDRQDTAHFVHLSCLQEEVPVDECLELGEEIIPAIRMHALPSRELHGMWDSLLFDTDVKSQLLQYAQTAMLFADRSVDQTLVTFNRLLLLHGPPGTGKTSLCKALGQKLAVRLAHRYDSGCLLEINSHSLFSRWFSESGKLVQQLFGRIEEIAADAKTLCVVLIDEVESLSAARNASGSEPSDALRVVNAMLTQLDQLKRLPNVLMLTTSNITAVRVLARVAW
jgi:predicted DNA-binding ribbon-helix-helix protein